MKREKSKIISKRERKNIMNMDWIERMIRVEQKVSSSFNKKVPYNRTIYYNSLSDSDKLNFERYLKRRKGLKSSLLILLLIITFPMFIFLNNGFTSFTVKLPSANSGILFSYLFIFLILITAFVVANLFRTKIDA